MKNLLTTLIFISLLFAVRSQTTVYSEDFNGALNWTLNTDMTGEGAAPNEWYVSCEEEGVGSGNCGTACAAGDATLHVSSNSAGGDLGAAYVESPFAATTTNRRAESPDINTTGQTNMTLSFDMIGNGGNANDFCELFYSTDGGATWVSLDAPLTSQCCDGSGNPVACSGAEQGLWQTNTYNLPAACENIPNLRISFVWQNLDDNNATDPSFAADNIVITAPALGAPVADFSTPSLTICEGDCIDFTDLSTGTPTTWGWDFGNGQTSASQNPTGICYSTAGSYTVSLTVTNANGSDNTTQTLTVNVCGTNPPTAAFTPSSTNLCEGDCIDFTDNSTDTPTSWSWDFGNGQTSTQQNPTNVCYATAGSYTVTLTATNANGSNTTSQIITVTACSGPPTSSFTPSQVNLCENDCISFADNSTGNPTSWSWDFGNGQTSTQQNPTNVCFPISGSYVVSLTVSNSSGTNSSTQTLTVTNCSAPQADFSIVDDSICVGDCIEITDLSTNIPTSWNWTFNGGTPASATTSDPGLICYDTPGSYTIDLTVSNAYGTSSVSLPITVGDYPTIVAAGDTTIDMGGEAILTSLGTGGDYNWVPSEYVDCPDCPDVIATPLLTTSFFAQMISPEGCVSQDTVIVTVNFMDIVDVPNSFSPNGDGLNDILYVKGVGITDMTFRVYNRYGELIYETTDQKEGWDGTFRGQEENPGVFLWTVEYTLVDDSTTTKSGTITLIK